MANNKIILGDEVLMDLTEDTVTEDTLIEGTTAHNAQGEPITGRASGGASSWNTLTDKPFDLVDLSDFSTETLFGHTSLKINQSIKTQIASAIGSAANVNRELVGVKASLARCQETADDAYSKAESVEAQIGDVESLLASL